MHLTRYPTAILFGGSGFIGSHLAAFLLEQRISDRVILVDLVPPTSTWTTSADRITFRRGDVRQEISADCCDVVPDLIVNLAAIHREPGHEAPEYFETNVQGAENVCRYAAATGCKTVIFISSISVYGPTEEAKDETSLPVPRTAYGASKLVAERIHSGWQEASSTDRRVLIVRPGVVFGPGEGGNVTRLVRAVRHGYFVYLGNHAVRKAGGYVRELCASLLWGLDTLSTNGLSSLTFNFTIEPTPRLDEFVTAIADVANRRPPRLSIPFLPLLLASHLTQAIASLAGIQPPLHPARARKLVNSNNIATSVLPKYGYQPTYSLSSALRDWKALKPSDWA